MIARFLAPVLVLAIGSVAFATGIDTSSPVLPPAGVYLTPAQVHAEYMGPGLDIILSEVQHKPFANGDPAAGIPAPTHTPINGGMDDLEQFSSQISGLVSVNGGPAQPITGSGPVSVIVSNYAPGDLGTFNTQMTQLDLTFPALPGAEIRVSPTIPTTGQTTISANGDGTFHINSFFDVFTELSLDNGQTWMPSTGGAQVNLSPLPEPSTVTLLAIGLVGLAVRGLRRARRR